MRRVSTILLLAVSTCLLAGTALGSGFSIPEQGAKASGMATAFVATADDPSAIFYNPAGLAQQRFRSLLGGGTFITFANQFTGDPNDPLTSGTTGKYDRHLFVIPNGYAVMPIGGEQGNLTFGVGTFAAYGLRTDWEDPWVGRFISRDVNLKTVSVQPTIAWQSGSGNDAKIAVGAGLEYRRARVTLNRNNAFLSPLNGRIYDVANAYLSSEWDHGIGWNAGILLKPTPTLRIGASYRSDMDIDVEGTADITQIPTGTPALDQAIAAQLPPDQAINMTIPFPATLAVGIATSAIDTWDLELDVTHTTWSRFETLQVNFEQTPAFNIVRPQNWEDTMAFRFGANKRATENWDVRFGAVYDQNPQPPESVSPLLPDADRVGVSFGVGWHRGPFIVDISNMVLFFQDRDTEGRSSEHFNGEYKTNANLLSVNFGLRF